MNLLADESSAVPVIRALREAGHDVVALAEVAKGATDEQVLERALNEMISCCACCLTSRLNPKHPQSYPHRTLLVLLCYKLDTCC